MKKNSKRAEILEKKFKAVKERKLDAYAVKAKVKVEEKIKHYKEKEAYFERQLSRHKHKQSRIADDIKHLKHKLKYIQKKMEEKLKKHSLLDLEAAESEDDSMFLF